MGTNGQPTPPTASADLDGLSQVFTGLSWYAGPNLTDRTSRALLRRQRRTSSATGGRCRTTTSTRRTPASTRSARRRSSAATIPAQTHARHRRRPEDRARHAVQPPERRPVHRQAADPAPGHEQPEPGLRRPRRGGVQQQRQRRARRHEGGLEGDPARSGSARRRHVDDAPASCASRCCAWRTCCAPSTRLDQRPLHRHRPHRRPGDTR